MFSGSGCEVFPSMFPGFGGVVFPSMFSVSCSGEDSPSRSLGAAVTFTVPFAAHAKGIVEGSFIKDIVEAARGFKDNPVGDAAIYTPKARIDGGAYDR